MKFKARFNSCFRKESYYKAFTHSLLQLINLFLIFGLLLFVYSCRKNGGSDTGIKNNIALTAITASPENIFLNAGDFMQIKVQPVPANATNVSFTYLSDNPAIATVTSQGLVTAKATGETRITIKSGSIQKVIPVKVTQNFKIQIGSAIYKIDTLEYSEVSPGVNWLKFAIPDFENGFGTLGKGLVVNLLAVDLANTNNKLEVCPASTATWGNIERPTAMYARKLAEKASTGYKPLAVINGDFYLLSTVNNTGYAYINNRPRGMEIVNGMVVQTPFNGWNTAFVFRENGSPEYSDKIAFSGVVEAGGKSFPLKDVNSYAAPGELVMFNNLSNSYPTDSAFAWSPQTSTMVSLSYPQGGWTVNNTMSFKVTGIDYNVETAIPAQSPYKGKDFNGQGAILVGNSGQPANDSKTFLGNLKVGDNVNINMNVKTGDDAITDKRLNVVGYKDLFLQNGIVTNTWNETHPRTAIGYSQDKKKLYLLVVDGRQANYSSGATTGHLGYILKAFGAYTGVNLDGGGSSCMVVNGEIKNKPSDGSERPVANGIVVLAK